MIGELDVDCQRRLPQPAGLCEGPNYGKWAMSWWRGSTGPGLSSEVCASHNYRASRKVIRWERAGDNRRAAGSRSSVSRQRCFIFRSAST